MDQLLNFFKCLIVVLLFACKHSANDKSITSVRGTEKNNIDSATVKGKILFPSEYPPEGECKLYAKTKEDKVIFLTSKFTWPEGGFQFKLPLGEYSFFCVAYNVEMKTYDTSYYTKFVLANFDSKSDNHEIITVNINKSDSIYNVCVCDWYMNN